MTELLFPLAIVPLLRFVINPVLFILILPLTVPLKVVVPPIVRAYVLNPPEACSNGNTYTLAKLDPNSKP